MDRKALAALFLPLAIACSDKQTPTSPMRPSMSAQAGKAAQAHQRHIRKDGHVYSIAAVDNSDAAKPPAAFYMFVDGRIQSVTSVVYTRTNGVWARKRARTTIFENGKPVHQLTLDAAGRATSSRLSPTQWFGHLGARARATVVSLATLALPDALAAQGSYVDGQILGAELNLASAQSQLETDNTNCGSGMGGCEAIPGDEAQVSQAAAGLQAALDGSGWSSDSGGGYDQNLYDTINAFIVGAAGAYCGADYCIYLMD